MWREVGGLKVVGRQARMWQVGSRQADSWTDGCTKGVKGLQSESGKRGRLRASPEVRLPKTAAPPPFGQWP